MARPAAPAPGLAANVTRGWATSTGAAPPSTPPATVRHRSRLAAAPEHGRAGSCPGDAIGKRAGSPSSGKDGPGTSLR